MAKVLRNLGYINKDNNTEPVYGKVNPDLMINILEISKNITDPLYDNILCDIGKYMNSYLLFSTKADIYNKESLIKVVNRIYNSCNKNYWVNNYPSIKTIDHLVKFYILYM